MLFQWKFYRRAIITWIFVPFIVYFLLIVFYTTYTYDMKVSGDPSGS